MLFRSTVEEVSMCACHVLVRFETVISGLRTGQAVHSHAYSVSRSINRHTHNHKLIRDLSKRHLIPNLTAKSILSTSLSLILSLALSPNLVQGRLWSKRTFKKGERETKKLKKRE